MTVNLNPLTEAERIFVMNWESCALRRIADRIGLVGCVKFDEIADAAIKRIDELEKRLAK